jgi:hypothetical protein
VNDHQFGSVFFFSQFGRKKIQIFSSFFFNLHPKKSNLCFLVYMVQKFTRKETWLWIDHKIEENKTEEGLFHIVAAIFTVNSKEWKLCFKNIICEF